MVQQPAAAPPNAPHRRIACIAGFGVGISAAAARRFGRAGFDVALLARREDRLQAGAEELKAAGVYEQGQGRGPVAGPTHLRHVPLGGCHGMPIKVACFSRDVESRLGHKAIVRARAMGY